MADIFFDGRIYIGVTPASFGRADHWNTESEAEHNEAYEAYLQHIQSFTSYTVQSPHPFTDRMNVTGLYELQYQYIIHYNDTDNEWKPCSEQWYNLPILNENGNNRRIIAIPTEPPTPVNKSEGAPCKVKILKCSFELGWYRNSIGDVFETDLAPQGKDYVLWEDYINKSALWRHIKHDDCEIVLEGEGIEKEAVLIIPVSDIEKMLTEIKGQEPATTGIGGARLIINTGKKTILKLLLDKYKTIHQ